MSDNCRGCSHGLRGTAWLPTMIVMVGMLSGVALVAAQGVSPALPVPMTAPAQATMAAPLVFTGVTVIDVATGQRLPAQTVVIVGNRIQAVGDVGAVKTPKGAQVVDARGKYLIPGLWDMHVHGIGATSASKKKLLQLIVNGVTGIREALTLDLAGLSRQRQEILAGMRVGPPRQIFSAPISQIYFGTPGWPMGPEYMNYQVTGADSARWWQEIDSLKRVGADMIKITSTSPARYFAVAALAHRVEIPFGGHTPDVPDATLAAAIPAIDVSDSGARIIDHIPSRDLRERCVVKATASIERCRPVAERFRHNGTWWVPTLQVYAIWGDYLARAPYFARRYKVVIAEQLARRDRMRSEAKYSPMRPVRDSGGAEMPGLLDIASRVGLPILAATDNADGFTLHAELALLVAEGLTSLAALQSATLNPAKMLRATDSLGTVAPGKLADLVLLDTDPLADITNTTAIHAVVANGRYYDRAALDRLLVESQAKAKREP